VASRAKICGYKDGVRPSAAVIVAATGAVLLAACGTSTSTGPSTPVSPSPVASSPAAATSASAPATPAAKAGVDSCSVVTQAEAASALGAKVTPGMLGTVAVDGGLACVFYGPSAPASRNANIAEPDTVRVVLVQGSKALRWYNDYHSKVPAVPVRGLGDRAFFDGGASLSILDGQDFLRISVQPAGARPSLAAEKKLAAAILPNL
jgi:uncharacterized protein DUF3558